ncbi:MAG: glycosyltransferase [Tepidisphaeraceae bacterium]|jgi:hypothetical protein
MDGAAPRILWTGISLLESRFLANVEALARRLPELARRLKNLTPKRVYHIAPVGDSIQLGAGSGLGVTALTHTLGPMTAKELARKLYPSGSCDQPVLVAGEDMGWLWNCLYQLPCAAPLAPGHRPPLFYVIGDLERLWVLVHVHDWQKLLADTRVRLFAGESAFAEFRAALRANAACPWPRISVAVDPSLWPAGLTIDGLIQESAGFANQRLSQVQSDLRAYADSFTPQSIAERYRGGGPLKVLGITSRYTTFLQYSMRGWLDAFARLGHQTELLIETADHELANNLVTAETCARFKPDLIVMIDHSRAEMGGLPQGVPMAMWAQDYMPKIYSREGAAAQGARDYVLGFPYEKMRLVHEMGYPGDRYLTATIGMDPNRFTPRRADDPELARYVCDVAFVTHASVPAEQIVKEQIDRNGTPEAKRLLGAIFEQLRAVYDSDRAVVAPPAIRRIIEQGFIDSRTQPTPELVQQLMGLFYMRVNDALFRHQSLRWLAGLGIDLRLYGRGWENNPTFKRFARGVANHQGELSLIYQASRINLHASPLGSLHQRVMEGLASGGFFLLRRGDGDIAGRHYARLWDFCQRSGITTDQQLRACTDPELQDTLRQVVDIHQCDPFAEKYTFMQLLQTMHECDYLCSAGCVWGSDYDETSFNSRAELEAKVTSFLGSPSERQRLRQSMLQPVLERFTYEKTSSRLLALIAADQARAAAQSQASMEVAPLAA